MFLGDWTYDWFWHVSEGTDSCICVAAVGPDPPPPLSLPRVYPTTLSMPGHYEMHLMWRHTPRYGDGMSELIMETYGIDPEVLDLYAISTAAHDANEYEVWTQPASYAAIGAKAYIFVGALREVLQRLYGFVGELPQELVYPEDYIPDIVGWAFVFKNYYDILDYYYQKFDAFDSPYFVHFTIDAEHPNLWFTSVKVYVGMKTMEDWRRPYRPPTPNCYGWLEDVLCQWRQWAMY